MNIEHVAVDAPDNCARCMAPPTQPFELQVGKNPRRADHLVKFTVRLCEDCRRRIRTATIMIMVSGFGLVVVGFVWSEIIESAAPLLIAGVAAIVAMFVVTGPQFRNADPLVRDDGPVRFRNAEYNSLFVARNNAFIKQLNAARREATTGHRGELPLLTQSFLRGGVYMGLFAVIVGFRTPAMLIGGIALTMVCGGVLVASSSK